MGLRDALPILNAEEAADLTAAAQVGDLDIVRVFMAGDKGQSFGDSQRALLGALLCQHGTLTQEEMGRAVSIARGTIQSVVRVLRNGDSDDVAKLGRGVSISSIAKGLRNPRKSAAIRAERIRENAALWKHLKTGIENITSLPMPAEVARIARNNRGSAQFVDERMPRALKWLEDFKHAWSRGNDPESS